MIFQQAVSCSQIPVFILHPEQAHLEQAWIHHEPFQASLRKVLNFLVQYILL